MGYEVNSVMNIKDKNGNNNTIYPVTKKENVIGLPESLNELSESISSASSAVSALAGTVAGKVDKVAGKGLSTNDFTDKYKANLDSLDTALDAKADASDLTATQNQLNSLNDEISALSTTVAGKASTSDVTSLATTVGGKADTIYVNTELAKKVNKETGKGLSTNDYTTAEKNKLAGIAEGANKTTVDSALSSTSTNPVQNKAVNTALSSKLETSTFNSYKTSNDTAVGNKADKTYVDNELAKKADLSALTSKADASTVSALSETVATKADSSTVSAISDRVSATETEQETLSARMDTFTKLSEGSTTGDAELADGRVGADGKTYDNIGGAIRGQVTDLKSDLGKLANEVDKGIYIGKIRNWFDKNDVIMGKRPDYTVGSSIDTLLDNTDGFVTKPIAINGGDIIRCNTKWASFTFYDSNGLCISRLSQDTITYTAPSNAKYIRLSGNQINSNYYDDFVFTINTPLPDRPVPYGSTKLVDDYIPLADTLESKSVNLFDKSCVIIGKTYKTSSNSHINSIEDRANTFICTQLFSVNPNDIIRCSKAWARFIYYDKNGTYVSTISDGNLEHTIPSNVYYMRYQCANITAPDYRDYFMLTINQPMPATYKPFGKIYKVGEIEERLSDVEKEIKPSGGKAIIILDFDQKIINNDNRIAIMEQYGWKPTFVGAETEQLTKQLLAKGWDLSTYWAESNVPTDSQLSEDSETALNACKLYVQTALASQEQYGLYNPVLWSCRQNKYGETLGKALEFYGYKMARGGSSGAFDISTINANFTRTNYNGIYSNNLATVKSDIDNAVANGYAINIFTHYVVDTAAEDRGYDCLKSVYLELMDYIKELENQNNVIVVNYHDFYQMLFPTESAINDNNRNVKRMNFIENKIV